MTRWALLLPGDRLDPAAVVAMAARPVATLVHDPYEALALVAARRVSGLLVIGWPQLAGVVEPAIPLPGRDSERRPQRLSAPPQRRATWTGRHVG